MRKPPEPIGQPATAQASEAAPATDGAAIREFERSLPMALLRAREVVMDRFRPMLREFGVTEQQWRVMRALKGVTEIDVSALAERSCILAPSLSRILRDLTDRGLVARRTTKEDRRVGLISITAAGRRLIADVGPHSEARYARIADLLGAEDLNLLYDLLDRLEARLGGANAKKP